MPYPPYAVFVRGNDEQSSGAAAAPLMPKMNQLPVPPPKRQLSGSTGSAEIFQKKSVPKKPPPSVPRDAPDAGAKKSPPRLPDYLLSRRERLEFYLGRVESIDEASWERMA